MPVTLLRKRQKQILKEAEILARERYLWTNFYRMSIVSLAFSFCGRKKAEGTSIDIALLFFFYFTHFKWNEGLNFMLYCSSVYEIIYVNNLALTYCKINCIVFITIYSLICSWLCRRSSNTTHCHIKKTALWTSRLHYESTNELFWHNSDRTDIESLQPRCGNSGQWYIHRGRDSTRQGIEMFRNCYHNQLHNADLYCGGCTSYHYSICCSGEMWQILVLYLW